MKTKMHLAGAGLLAMMLLFSGWGFGIPASRPAQGNYDDARSLVQRTQDDLANLRNQGSHNGKERERIDKAKRQLSDFDRKLSKNRYDKGSLGEGIEALKDVVDHNTLEPRDRDALNADLTDLRALHGDH